MRPLVTLSFVPHFQRPWYVNISEKHLHRAQPCACESDCPSIPMKAEYHGEPNAPKPFLPRVAKFSFRCVPSVKGESLRLLFTS